MWNLYGTESPTNFSNPEIIQILDFKPSASIPESDFINESKTWLCYNDTVNIYGEVFEVQPNPMSAYTKIVGHRPVNLINHNRWNIVHPKWVNEAKTYTYDGCAYKWAFNTPGTGVYYFTAIEQGNEAYNYTPQIHFTDFTLNEINYKNVISLYLVAVESKTTASGCGAVRPLFGVDLSGYTFFDTYPVHYFLGPVIPSPVINEWLKNTFIVNPDIPVKPTGKADETELTSANFSWRNSFKIMNFDNLDDYENLWPEHLLIDNKYMLDPSDPDYVNIKNYFVWNDSNDTTNRYHYFDNFTSADTVRNIERRINEIIEIGSFIDGGFKITDAAQGYFGTNNSTIDDFSGQGLTGNYRQYSYGNMPKKVSGYAFTMEFNDYTLYSLSKVDIHTDNYWFRLENNYPHNNISFMTCQASGSSDIYVFNDCMIIRHEGHFYLGGVFRAGRLGNIGQIGFAILCRIDNLDELENYGGNEPGDPANTGDKYKVGISARLMTREFGPGDDGTENPNTDAYTNKVLGDAPDSDDDGSAYNLDGTPKDPADEDGTGTGEKNTHPVDSQQVPNKHDGSVGNGTGNPHDGDEEIDDPADSLPSGINSEGTVSGSGVITVFTPTLAELNTFTSEMLSNTVLDSIKNYFTTNPMDGIFGLHVLPYTGFAGVTTGSPKIGSHTFTSTMTLAGSEFLTVDYGTIFVPFAYDGYENYAPHSDAKIFLPFLGMKDIDINMIQGCHVNLKYNISLVTGDIYAYLYSQWAAKWGKAETNQGVNHLVYHWQGNCASTVPLSHLDSTNYIAGAMQTAGSIASLAAGAATANPLVIPAGVTGLTQGIAEIGRTSIITSGNISGVSAFMGCREPYLIISRPIMAYNGTYRHYLGQRANAIEQIAQLTEGTFTMMRNVDLSSVRATGDELNEIESILRGGFYI